MSFHLHPRLQEDTYYLGDFPLSAVLLSKDANYPWFILVPRIADIREIHELTTEQQQTLICESSTLAKALQTNFCADKMNVCALGNVVEQLHIHHIVRYQDDACWPKPIWGAVPANAYTPETLKERSNTLIQALQPFEFTKKTSSQSE